MSGQAYEGEDGSFKTVADDTLLAAIAAADSRAVNGLPDSKTVADECALSQSRIKERVRRFESQGLVARHTSLIPNTSGVVKTVELTAAGREVIDG